MNVQFKVGEIRSELDHLVVDYPRRAAAHAVFDRLRAHARAQGSGPKRCVQMIGPSHAGKSTIVETYAKLLNTPEALARREIPIFHVKPDANLTRKGMAENVLETFEDYGFRAPPMSGSENTLLRRMRAHLKAAKVQLLVLDDFQHVVHSETHKVAYSVSETIKGLLIKGVCPIVMVGVEEARQPLRANPQLALRAEPTIELRALNASSGEDAEMFMKFMASYLLEIEQTGAATNASTLLQQDIVLKLFVVTDGILGRACNLVKDAVVRAAGEGRSHLIRDDLAVATDLVFLDMKLSKAKNNPFRGPA